MVIKGSSLLKGASGRSYGDHRLAMTLGVAGTARRRGNRGAGCRGSRRILPQPSGKTLKA